MKRILTLCTVFVLVAGFLFAGGQGERAEVIEDYEPDLPEEALWDEDLIGTQPEFPELAGEEVTLTLSAFSSGQIEYLDEWANNFEELFGYIDLTIDVQQVPYDEMHNSLASQLVAGTGAPDLITIEVSQTSRFFVPPFESEFLDLELPGQASDILARQEPYRDTNGRQTGIEVADAHPGFLYYRADIFEEAGVDIEDIETWDDYIAAGEQILDETGHLLTNYAIEAEIDGAPITSLFVQNGNPLYEDGDFVMNDSNSLEVLEKILEAREAGILADEFMDDSTLHQRYLGEIEDDQIASFIMPNWYFNSRLRSDVDEPNWRIAPAPTFDATDNDTFTWGGTGISVVESQTDYPELAEAFVQYTLTTPNQLNKFEVSGFLPVTQPALDSSEFVDYTDPEIFGDQPVGQIYADAIDGMPGFSLGETWPEVQDEFNATFSEILDDPKAWLDHMEEFEADLR